MKKLKIITWNVNSIRKRIDLLIELIKEEDPDFIFLQETKIEDNNFPEVDNYINYLSGEKGKNGVAILSKYECEYVENLIYLGRLVSVKFNNLILCSLYMYNGFSNLSPKEKKIELYKWMTESMKEIETPMIVGGDFNIVYKTNEVTMENPYEADEIHYYQQWEKHFFDTTPNEKFITWWDYRQMSFHLNKGYGLDKFYLKNHDNFQKPQVLKHFRAKPQPSDHAPLKIIINFED